MNRKITVLIGLTALLCNMVQAASVQQISSQLSSAKTQKDFVLALQSLLEIQKSNDTGDLKAVKAAVDDARTRYYKLFPSRDDKFPALGSDPSLLDPTKLQTLVTKYAPSAAQAEPTPSAPTRQAPPARPMPSQQQSPAASSSSNDSWWSTLVNAATQTPTTYPRPSAPQQIQEATNIPELTTDLSKLSVKSLAQVLRGVGSTTKNMPQPTVSGLQSFTVGTVLSGLYRALDALEKVIDDIKNRNLSQTVPTLDRYLITRLLNIAGKLG